MINKNTRRGFTQLVINKNCHSRGMLSGIYAFFNSTQGEDPRQKPSGRALYSITARGFTLIELLVVVLIIGILAAVALPQYQKAVIKTRFATLKHLVKSIANAEQLYYLANGNYTQSFEELDIDLPNENVTDSTADNHVYSWGNCYLYLNGKGDPTVACIHNQIHMQYSVAMPSNVYSCWVFASTEAELTSGNYAQQMALCQQETQSTTDPGKGYMFFNNQRYRRWTYE